MDTARHRLFIARQTRVMVVDPDSGKLLGEVPGLNGAHGVALAYATGHGFATSGHDSTVTMFDLATLHVLRRTKAADDADAVLYDPASKRIFTFNGDAATSSVLDPVSGALIGSIPLGGKPEFGVTTGDGTPVREPGGQGGDRGDRSRRRCGCSGAGPSRRCEEPTGLAIDRDHHLLFSGCHNKLMAISDAAQGKMIAQVPIGGGVDGDAFDPVVAAGLRVERRRHADGGSRGQPDHLSRGRRP